MLPDDEQQTTTTMTADEYVKQVNELKKNSVPKEEYEKLLAEKKTLIKGMIDGNLPDDIKAQVDNKQNTPDIQELRKKLAKSGDEPILNCDYVETVLQLRQAALDRGETDPFLPQGVKANPTLIDLQGAQRVADGLQFCLDEARGEDGKLDPVIFNAQFTKILAEDNAFVSARLKAKKKK